MERRFKRVLRNELTQSENMVLGEMERMFGILDRKIETLQKDVQGIKEYYHIVILEQDNMKLTLQRLSSLSERVGVLERIAVS